MRNSKPEPDRKANLFLSGHPAEIELYQSRILALEADCIRVKSRINQLLRMLDNHDCSISEIRTRLAIYDRLVNSIKAQIEFYTKLGVRYDIAMFHEELIKELTDPHSRKVAEKAIIKIMKKWSKISTIVY
jgi:hypothetical protein